MNSRRYDAVFLDIGGTVVEPDPSFHEVVARVCRQSGLAITSEDVERVEPAVFAQVAASNMGFPLTDSESRRFWHHVYTVFCQQLGVPAHDHLADRLYRTFLDVRTWRVCPDAREAILTIRERGYRLVAVSNWEEWLDDLLEHLGVLVHLDLVLSSSKAQTAKPDPRIFHLALERAELTADRVVHVGDNPRDDVAGALSAGITPVLLDRLGRHADFVGWRIHDLRQLPDLLES